MTQFEYVSVAASLVFALILARVCESLPAVFAPSRSYWIHALWVVSLFNTTIGAWWSLWGIRDVKWTPVGFAALMLLPTLMFVRTVILLSDESEGNDSWRDIFFRNRRRFFAVSAISALASISLPTSLHVGGQGSFPYWAIGVGLIVGLNIVGYWTSEERVHAVLVVLSLFLGLGWLIPTA